MSEELLRRLAGQFALIDPPVAALNLSLVAVQQAPHDPTAQIALGHAAERAERPDMAIEAYLAAVLISEGRASEVVEVASARLLSLLSAAPERLAQTVNRLTELGERVALSGSVVHLLGRLLISRGLVDRAARQALTHIVERGWGWRQSLKSEVSADAAGEPLPFYTYPCIAYLDQLDWSDRAVFEYGAGQSTLYWAKRCRFLRSVDNNLDWTRRFAPAVPGNVSLSFVEDDAFARAIIESPETPDLIIVDGHGHRFDCAGYALERLAEDGAILLDNADSHPETARRLRDGNLIEVDFVGLKPTELAVSTTSLFLRPAFRARMRGGAGPKPGLGARVLRSQWDEPG